MEQRNGDRGQGLYKRLDEYIEDAVNDTDHVSELPARSFYKILRKNGFGNEQIIYTENNLLDCLIESLYGYKEDLDVIPGKTNEIDLHVNY